MLKKLLPALFIFIGLTSKADEGMWMLPLIEKYNIDKMHEMGSELNASQIYNTDSASLKDAIVIFGNGCTGEIISDQGLILTNHHCGYGTIQEHSSVDHDYLKDGFWAQNMQEEIPSPGLSVTFIRGIEDVTSKVLRAVNADMQYADYKNAIDSVTKALVKSAQDSSGYTAQIKPFYSGNQYYLFLTEKYTDVRFVGAPPSSIGKFGADTDNWMWPRHTGDFSIFRVYATADGKPADYSADNVPLKPKYHLPISLKGPQMNDFAMTIGFPGSTNRYLTSYGIEERMDVINKARIVVRDAKQKIWLNDMLYEQKIRIQYASKYSRSTNYYKNSIGMNNGLENLKVLEKKQELENRFEDWVKNTPEGANYKEALPMLQDGYNLRRDIITAKYFYGETFLNGIEIFNIANAAKTLSQLDKNSADSLVEARFEAFQKKADKFYKNYNPETDRKTMIALLKVYADHINSDYYPEFYNEIGSKYKGDYKKFSNKLFSKSIFSHPTELQEAIDKRNYKKISKDLAMLYSNEVVAMRRQIDGNLKPFEKYISKGNRLFEAGLHEMLDNKVFYPDANFTIRMSAGNVGDYQPKDGVHYNYYTTLSGVMEKEDPNNWEFVVPAKLKELYNNHDYGNYANADGTMPVCFTTNNDITGGNSGSPVINAKGELFGLAFDGNWEAMSGDIAFEPQLQKCINVDIRYVLFIIDKFAGASWLIDEMTLVN